MNTRIIIKPSLMTNPVFKNLTKEEMILFFNIASLFAEHNSNSVNLKLAQVTFNNDLSCLEGIFFIHGDKIWIGDCVNYFKNNTENTRRARAKRKTVVKTPVKEVIQEPIIEVVIEPIVEVIEEVKEEKKDTTDYEKIVELHNNLLKDTAVVKLRDLSPKRVAKVNSFYKNMKRHVAGADNIYEFYEFYFENLPKLNQMKGIKSWRPDFDYVFRDSTFDKLKDLMQE